MSPASALLMGDLGRLPGLQNTFGFTQQEALAETPRTNARLVRQCHSCCSCSCLSLSSAGTQHVFTSRETGVGKHLKCSRRAEHSEGAV